MLLCIFVVCNPSLCVCLFIEGGGVVFALGVLVGVLFRICFDEVLSYVHCVGLLVGLYFISFVC